MAMPIIDYGYDFKKEKTARLVGSGTSTKSDPSSRPQKKVFENRNGNLIKCSLS
jgi:hypothetical protein